VSMLRGQSTERRLMDRAATKYVSASRALSLQRFGSDVLDTYVLRYVGILAAFTAMLPAIMKGAAGHSEALEDPTKYFLTCLHLLVQVGMALKDLVLSHKALATTRGLATRVHELLAALESSLGAAAAPAPSGGEGATVVSTRRPPDAHAQAPLLLASAVRVCTPDGAELVRDVTFEVSAGMRVLVRGPNGAGKSSLLRVLTGVWPLGASGGGKVEWGVDVADRLVLPQRSYLIPQLSLRANLAYPEVSADGEATPRAAMPADAELLALLQRVGLSKLAPNGAADLRRAAGADGLSPGERQRLGLARLLLRRPSLALLDEPCSAVEPAFEALFFAECAAAGMTLLTVAHRPELAQHHTHELRLDGQGRATFKELSGSEGSEEAEVVEKEAL